MSHSCEREAELRAAGRRVHERGDLAGAESNFEECLPLARHSTDARLVDLRSCNRAGIRVALGTGDEEVSAAFDSPLESQRDQRVPRLVHRFAGTTNQEGIQEEPVLRPDRARSRGPFGHGSWLSGVRNQIGNALLATNVVPEAIDCYEEAWKRSRRDRCGPEPCSSTSGYCRTSAGSAGRAVCAAWRARCASLARPWLTGSTKHRLDWICRSATSTGLGGSGSPARRARAPTIAGDCSGPRGSRTLSIWRVEGAPRRGVAEAEGHFARLQTDYYPEQPSSARSYGGRRPPHAQDLHA